MRRTAILAAVALLVPAATARASFERPFTVTKSAEQFPNGFSAAVNSGGRAAFAWSRSKSILFRARSGSGTLTDTITVAKSTRDLYRPQVALATDGTALVAWTEKAAGDTTRLFAAVRPSGGKFGKPWELGPSIYNPEPDRGDYPLVGFNAQGDALVTWRLDFARSVGFAWRAPGHNFKPTQHLSVDVPLSLTFLGDGGAAVVVSRGRRAAVEETRASRRGVFAKTGDHVDIPPSSAGVADVGGAQAADGTALAFWRNGYQGDPGVGPDAGPVFASTRSLGTTLGAPAQLTACNALHVNGVMSSLGAAVVTWDGACDLQLRRWTAAAGWDPVVALGRDDLYSGGAALVADGNGNVLVAWLTGPKTFATTFVRPDGTTTPIEAIVSSGQAQRTSVKGAAAGDRAVLVWGSGGGYQATLTRTPAR